MCRSTHNLWTSLTGLLRIGHLHGTAAFLKTLWLFSLFCPLIPFCPLISRTAEVFPDGQRCLKYAQSTALMGGSCRNHCLEANILAPAPPARPPCWLWQGCDVEASVLHGHRYQQGLRPPRVPLAGGLEIAISALPMELGGCRGRNSTGRGYRPSCRTGVTLLLQRRQNPSGQGAWP